MRGDAPPSRAAEGMLRAAAWLYRGVAAARDAGFRRGVLRAERVPARVISVGNLTAGGTGKTPLVALAARRLMAMGRRVAILTRGYRRTERGLRAVAPTDPPLDWRRLGDEPALLRRLLPGVPLVIAADRVAAAQEALRRFEADTLILDDGFQHRWLGRDADVVLLDAVRPLDDGHLLPRGLLREPPAALARADLVVLTADELPVDWEVAAAGVARWARGLPVAGAVRTPTGWIDLASGAVAPLEALRGRRAAAFAGIARPQSLRVLLARAGVEVAAFLPFRDHHPYTAADLGAVAAAAKCSGADLVVTTEKDAVRLAGLQVPDGLTVEVLRIAMDIAWKAAAFWAVVEGDAAGAPA